MGIRRRRAVHQAELGREEAARIERQLRAALGAAVEDDVICAVCGRRPGGFRVVTSRDGSEVIVCTACTGEG